MVMIANPTRRRFLTASATAGGAMLAGLHGGRAWAAAPGRKEVRVGGKRVKVVDMHAHCIIPAGEALAKDTPLARGNTASNLVIGPERLQSMDARGIDIQALSINMYWWYGADRALAAKIVRAHDEGLAAICKASPDRFVGLSSVALQYPDLAAEQLEYAVKTLGLRGASLGGHVNGEAPSLPKYDPFWAKAEALGVPVFMHPNNADNIAREKAWEGRIDLGNLIGNPLETTVFLARLIVDGTFDRFPGLKVCGAHGGGFLPSYLGRMTATCGRANAKCAAKAPQDYLRTQILADTMVFSEEGLRHLVAEMGAGQIVYGSDMPYAWPDTIDTVVNAKAFSDAEKEAMLGGNLLRLLKIPA